MAAPQALARPPPAALFRSPAVVRRESNLGSTRRSRTSLGEVVGEATADVAAVACCIPLAVVDLAVLTVYKVPAGICRKAWKNKKRRRIKRRRKAMSLPPVMCERQGLAVALDGDGDDDMSLMRARRDDSVEMDDSVWGSDDVDDDTWQPIYGSGFWRSDDSDNYYDHRFQH